MTASIFLSDLSQISRITLNFMEHQRSTRTPQACQHALYVAFLPSIYRSPFRTANNSAGCPTVNRAALAALARRRRYELIVEAVKEVKSSLQLTYHSKSTQTSPLQASPKKVVEDSRDGTPARRVVVVFDSDEEGLERVLPAFYPVDEASPPFAQAYGSPDLSPPTPAQRQGRYVSPSPHSSSSDYLPIPGAFPLTPCLVQEPTTPHNENTQRADDFDGYDYTEDPERSSPAKGVKEERDDYDFL